MEVKLWLLTLKKNTESGTYQQAIGILHTIAYTTKMSNNDSYKIKGFFDNVVPPAGKLMVANHTYGSV